MAAANKNHTLFKVRGKLIGYRIKYWREDLDEITESQYLLSRSVEPHALIIGEKTFLFNETFELLTSPFKYCWVT